LKHLSPEEQQTLIFRRSCYMMGLGSAIVILISDPMVAVLGELGARTGIPAFYIAFVLAPMASNASELVAAYNYAQKKTRASISISLATLLGAAIMNNTFVLGMYFSCCCCCCCCCCIPFYVVLFSNVIALSRYCTRTINYLRLIFLVIVRVSMQVYS
jgi:hypothetical protein